MSNYGIYNTEHPTLETVENQNTFIEKVLFKTHINCNADYVVRQKSGKKWKLKNYNYVIIILIPYNKLYICNKLMEAYCQNEMEQSLQASKNPSEFSTHIQTESYGSFRGFSRNDLTI